MKVIADPSGVYFVENEQFLPPFSTFYGRGDQILR